MVKRIVIVLALVVGLLGTISQLVPMAMAQFTDVFVRPGERFVVNIPGNAGPSDTVTGPSVYCFGKRQVIALVRANSGRCSLALFQVSNNDTTWQYTGSLDSTTVSMQSNLSTRDSLNRGGQTLRLFPLSGVSASGLVAPDLLLDWKYARIVILPVSDRADIAGDTESQVDSMSIGYYVEDPLARSR